MANHSWRYLSLFLCACWEQSSTQEPVTAVELVEASEKVIFASVEELGTHVFLGAYSQQEFHGEELRSEHEDIFEIRWRDWDHFQARRMAGEEVVSDIVIANSQTWEWVSNKWVQRNDGELYRVQLRNTWNQWEQMMRPFSEHVSWVKEGEEEIEGRQTYRYRGDFLRPDSVQASLRPTDFKGTVWVDKETAVRILADVSGTLVRDAYKKKVQLKIQRRNIGDRFDIEIPK